MKLALCQMLIVKDKKTNLKKAQKMIKEAVKKESEMIILPEMFNCPYSHEYFKKYAENEESSITLSMLKKEAKENNVYIIGGSIAESDKDGNIFNTCYVINSRGDIIGKHRKMHLFDIDVKNKISFKESLTFTPGDKVTVINTPWGKIGVQICYDIRFLELTRLMALQGAKVIITPASFNTTTGSAHWHILFKSRALDNGVFTVAVSPARNEKSSYLSYGHSLIVNPWGQVLCELNEKENILCYDINLNEIENVREALPIIKNRRKDVYSLSLNKF